MFMMLIDEIKKRSVHVDDAINELLPVARPEELYKASRYLVDAGGKRLRPAVLILAAEAVGSNLKSVLPAAVAVELVHNFTLIHDDMYGETNVAWSEDKVPVSALLNRCSIGQDMEVELYRNGEKIVKNFSFNYVNPMPIRRYYPEYEPRKYEIIGGMVVMELALNHLSQIPFERLLKYKDRRYQEKSRLLITHILPNSQAKIGCSLLPLQF